jgi:hypothetical protein
MKKNRIKQIQIDFLSESGKFDISFKFEGSEEFSSVSEFKGRTRVSLDGVIYLLKKSLNQVKDLPELWGDEDRSNENA